MIRDRSLLPDRVASAIIGFALIAGPLALPAVAQESAEEPVAEPMAAEAAVAEPTEPAPDAAATDAAAAQAEGETVATIPVPSEDSDVEDAPRYPYSFAAARMVHVEYDDVASDGFGVEGSYLLMPNAYAIAAYVAGETDAPAGGVETSQFELGAGYRQELGGTMELNAGLRMLQLQTRGDTSDRRNELGFRADLGVRATLLPKLEGNAAIWYVDAANNTRAYLAGSALYEILPRLSLGAEAVVGSSSVAYSVLGRWAF